MYKNILKFLPQFKATILVIFGAIPTGFHYGWTAPIIPIYSSPNATFQITKPDELWLEATYLISDFMIIPITAIVMEKYGPRLPICIAAIGMLISFILIGCSTSIVYFYVARVFGGGISHVSYVATPAYIAEIASKNVRGVLCGLNYQLILIGVLIVYALISYCPLWVHVVVGSVLSIIQIISIAFLVPESPYYLVKQKKFNDAKLVLRSLRGKDLNIDGEFDEIVSAIERQQKIATKPWDLFYKKRYRKVLVIATMMAALESFTGFMIITMDLHSILSKAETFIFPYETWAVVYSGLTCVGVIICSATVDIFGRRPLLIVSSIFTGLALIIVGAYFHVELIGYDVDSYNWVIPIAMMFYALIYRIGLATIPQIYFSEIFSENVKFYGLPYSDLVLVVFGIFSVVVYNYVNIFIGIYLSMYIFGCIGLGAAIYTFIFVPETKGKTLDEIQLMFEGKD